MQAINIIIFYSTFIVSFLIAISIFVFFHNKKAKIASDRFVIQANALKPTVFPNVRLRYWTTYHFRTKVSPNCRCDLFLFEDCLAIVRRQSFAFKLIFAPVIITSNEERAKIQFGFLEIYKPGSVKFNRFTKGVIDIKVPDSVNKTVKIDITFMGLKEQQVSQLDKIKNWC